MHKTVLFVTLTASLLLGKQVTPDDLIFNELKNYLNGNEYTLIEGARTQQGLTFRDTVLSGELADTLITYDFQGNPYKRKVFTKDSNGNLILRSDETIINADSTILHLVSHYRYNDQNQVIESFNVREKEGVPDTASIRRITYEDGLPKLIMAFVNYSDTDPVNSITHITYPTKNSYIEHSCPDPNNLDSITAKEVHTFSTEVDSTIEYIFNDNQWTMDDYAYFPKTYSSGLVASISSYDAQFENGSHTIEKLGEVTFTYSGDTLFWRTENPQYDIVRTQTFIKTGVISPVLHPKSYNKSQYHIVQKGGQLSIAGLETTGAQVQLFDLKGRHIFTKETAHPDNKKILINLQGIASGCYLISIKTESRTVTQRHTIY